MWYNPYMKKFCAFIACVLVASAAACSRPAKTPAAFSGEPVAVMSIFAFDSESQPTYGLMYLGHSFLSFENVSDGDIAVGALTLAPGEFCTVGSWGMNVHFGIWYNIEANYIVRGGMYDGRTSVSKTIGTEDLAAVNAFFAATDKWSPLYNCANMAVDAYNAAGGDTLPLSGIITPTRVIDELRRWTHVETNRPVGTYGIAGYLTEDGFEEYEYRD